MAATSRFFPELNVPLQPAHLLLQGLMPLFVNPATGKFTSRKVSSRFQPSIIAGVTMWADAAPTPRSCTQLLVATGRRL